MCTLFLALAAICTIIVSINNNNELIRESIESRVAEHRPLISIRRYPDFRTMDEGMYLEIENFGKGNAYNINYSYQYYDFFTKRIIFEFRETYSSDGSFTVLEPGKVLSFFTEEDRKRFNIREPDGLPFIFAFDRSEEIKRTIREDSTLVVCAVYVEYEDFKGNVFWTARQFGRPPMIDMGYKIGKDKPAGPFMQRARERAVKGIEDFLGSKVFDRQDLLQTEKLEDTLWKKVLK